MSVRCGARWAVRTRTAVHNRGCLLDWTRRSIARSRTLICPSQDESPSSSASST